MALGGRGEQLAFLPPERRVRDAREIGTVGGGAEDRGRVLVPMLQRVDREEFRRAYGEWVFLAPPLTGPSGLVWLVPLLLILGGGAIAVGRVRRTAVPAEAPPTEPDARVVELRARVAREEAAEG